MICLQEISLADISTYNLRVGNIALTDGAILTDQNIDNDIYIPSGKNGLLIGPSTVGVGVTIDIAPGSTLVVV